MYRYLVLVSIHCLPAGMSAGQQCIDTLYLYLYIDAGIISWSAMYRYIVLVSIHCLPAGMSADQQCIDTLYLYLYIADRLAIQLVSNVQIQVQCIHTLLTSWRVSNKQIHCTCIYTLLTRWHYQLVSNVQIPCTCMYTLLTHWHVSWSALYRYIVLVSIHC